MPNLAKLYTNATGEDEAGESPVDILDAGLQELKWSWLKSTITQEVFKKLIHQEAEMLNRAVVMATQSQPDTLTILRILANVAVIRGVREEFSNAQTKPQIKPQQVS